PPPAVHSAAGLPALSRGKSWTGSKMRLPDSRNFRMPRIDIRHPHRLLPAEARATVDRIASRMQEKFGLAGRWEGDAFGFARQGVKGTIAVGADEVRVSA